MKVGSLFTFVLATAAACSAQAVDVPGPVVTAAWVHQNLSQVTVLDVRYDLKSFGDAPQYRTDEDSKKPVLVAAGGHIPGALGVEYGAIRVKRQVEGHEIGGWVPSMDDFQALMQNVGLNGDKAIIITSPSEDGGTVESATRLYWTLKYFGQTNLAILDGGNAAWLQDGLPVATDAPPSRKGSWTAKAPDSTLIAHISEVKAAMASGKQFIDARTPTQYTGLSYKKPSVKAGGHIDGARNLPPELRTRHTGIAATFLRADEYRNVMQSLGIDGDKPTVHYCNSGHLASSSWFIQHEILGNKQATLYDGSMSEWTTLGNPVIGLNAN